MEYLKISCVDSEGTALVRDRSIESTVAKEVIEKRSDDSVFGSPANIIAMRCKRDEGSRANGIVGWYRSAEYLA